MKASNYSISLSFNQILELIRQLPRKEKIKLTKELEKEVIDSKLTYLLNAFKTEELSIEEIQKEVEMVRQEIYDKSKKN